MQRTRSAVVFTAITEKVREPKIRHFDLQVATNEDIAGAQVSVENAFTLQVGHAVGNLDKKFRRLVFDEKTVINLSLSD